jgi:hypothetical protein
VGEVAEVLEFDGDLGDLWEGVDAGAVELVLDSSLDVHVSAS